MMGPVGHMLYSMLYSIHHIIIYITGTAQSTLTLQTPCFHVHLVITDKIQLSGKSYVGYN